MGSDPFTMFFESNPILQPNLRDKGGETKTTRVQKVGTTALK